MYIEHDIRGEIRYMEARNDTDKLEELAAMLRAMGQKADDAAERIKESDNYVTEDYKIMVIAASGKPKISVFNPYAFGKTFEQVAKIIEAKNKETVGLTYFLQKG